MKKNWKKGLMVFALACLVTGAIANEVLSNRAENEVYTWTKVGVEQPPFIGTKAEAQDHFGCSGTVDQCAVGTPLNPTLPNEVIYQN